MLSKAETLLVEVDRLIKTRQATKDTWEPFTSLAALQLAKPGMFCIDIGAHIGWYTALFARLAGSTGLVMAFEPTENFSLELKVSLGAHVHLYHNALSDVNRWVSVARGPALSLFEPKDKKALGTFRVFYTVLDTFIQDFFVQLYPKYRAVHEKSPCLIKLDVDGHEVPIIRGAKNFITTRKPTIILECAPDFARLQGYDLAEALHFLKSLGYVFNADHGQLHGINLSVDTIMNGVPKMSSWNIICSSA